MAYQNFYYNKYENTCHIWDDISGHTSFQYDPYAFLIDPKGEYKTLTNLKVKRVKKWSEESVKQGLIYEHDVPVATKVLIDNYFESDEPSRNHRILIFDIEVEKGLKYSTVKEVDNRITSIAYHYNGRYVCLLLDENDRITDGIKSVRITNTNNSIEVILKRYDTERELLSAFLSQWNVIKPTIVSGWHSQGFDIPYLYNRLCKVLNKTQAKRLSPIEIIEIKDFGREYDVKIAGVAHMDYLQLYKKFTYNEEPSYKLEAISQKQLGRGKFKYEGTLDDLYENDLDGFIEYNVNDVELIVAMDKKMGLIEIARGTCHKGHVPYDDFMHSSVYLNGAIQTRCKRKGIITTGTISKNEGKAKGGYVKNPKVGLHRWLQSIDLQSLYPSLIITQNISSETQIGYIANWRDINLMSVLLAGGELNKNIEGFGFLQDDVEIIITPIIHELFSEKSASNIVLTKPEFIEYMMSNSYTISGHGIIYDARNIGIIPEILDAWFSERLEYKELASKFKESDYSKYEEYDRKQAITKILLNSLYGVLLLPSFRYYDKKNGESVTLSGQDVIKFTDYVMTSYYKNKRFDGKEDSPVVYGDTDSAYLEGIPLIENYENLSEREIVSKLSEISNENVAFINKSVQWLSKHHFNSNNNRLKFMPEKIIKRGFWGQAKKRYALLTIDSKTLETEVVIKGFESVKSSFPKAFREQLKNTIIDILHDVQVDELNTKVRAFKTEYIGKDIFDIMLPTSVKKLSKFKPNQKRTPIHVKSAQNYNKLLNVFEVYTLPPIADGDKILYAYMKQNPFNFETMALKGQDEDPPEIIEFVKKFIDREKVFENTFVSKLETIWEDLGWGKVQTVEPTNFF